MASSSSPRPWVVLGRIAVVPGAAAVGQGSGAAPAAAAAVGQGSADVTFTISPAPQVSVVAISPRLLPEAITHREPDNPSVLAVDASGGLLLINVILRRASASQPIIVDVPGQARYVLVHGFVASYLVVDTAANTAYSIPQPGILKEASRVGILRSPSGLSGAAGYVVAELQLTHNSGNVQLLYFESRTGQWARKRIPSPIPSRFPIPPDRFSPDCVLSHDGRLWWVDVSYGLITWDSLSRPLALSFVELPPHKAFHYRGPKVPDLDKHRCVRVSNDRLCFIDMDSNNINAGGMRKISVWTLEANLHSTPISAKWSLQSETIFQTIWSHNSYRATQLPKRMPTLAFIHPTKPWVVYFFLENHLFGIDLRGHSPIVVDCDDYRPVLPSGLVSSRSFHAWEGELQYICSTLSGDTKPDFQVQRKYTGQVFRALYGECLYLHGAGAMEAVNAYSGQNGQTMVCASEALKHWNNAHSTSYEIDATNHMDSNAFNESSSRKFDVEQSYFHVNFYGKSSGGGEKQLFFAELNGRAGPDNTMAVTLLGHDEDAITGSSGEHICQCCTGLMHPYSTSFVGCEVTTTHQHESTST